MQLSHQQNQALDAIGRWMKTDDPVFYLAGFAGTGKTTLAKYVQSGKTIFAAFTGKAAYVLKQKGCEAFTIHQLIYQPKERSRERLLALQTKLANTTDEVEIKKLEADIAFEHKKLNSPNFVLNPDSPIKEADLLVIDECSMVSHQMAEDLMSFGTKILALGDPAQLPPVFGSGFLAGRSPDISLTEIHRQALENPILRIATGLRNRQLPAIDNDMVVPWGSIEPEEALTFEQILVGRNRTRKAANDRVRGLKGIADSDIPVSGDRLVCLRNDHEVGLLNGSTWTVDECYDPGDEFIDLIVTDGAETLAVQAHKHHFMVKDDRPLPFWIRKEAQEFDFGYALTVHKAQGSEFDSVLVFDESDAFGNDRFRWLYTAATRAANRLKLVLSC